MSKVKIADIISCMNDAPSGSFVAITDYEGQDGTVKTVQGQIGVDYASMKQLAIKELKDAIALQDFEPITVSGKCWANPDGSFASRKSNDRTLLNFNETFTTDQVVEVAEEILESWENPTVRKSNKVQLTDKKDGLSFNTETGRFNFSLFVFNEYYKVDKTAEAKAGKPVNVKASMPDTVLKKQIRGRFEKKYRAFTIAEGRFKSLSIAGETFIAENITL